MAYIASTRHARQTDRAFVVAAARAFYCDWFLSDESRARRIAAPGRELTEHIPESQRWSFALARRFAEGIEQAYGQSLDDVLKAWRDTWRAHPHSDRDPDQEENIGWYAAMEAMGHGVGLFLFGIEDARLPHAEAYPGAPLQ